MTVRQKHHSLPRLLTALAVVFLIAGSLQAQFAEPEITVLNTLTAETSGDNFGFVAESIGDIDGDGAPDYIVGAPFRSEGAFQAGKVYIYSGADGSLLHSIVGTALFERVGFSVAGGQDLNGDGVSDYVVGASAVGPTAGRVAAYSGADHSLIFQVSDVAGSRYAFDINLAGDLNGDGRSDVLVGAPRAAALAGRVDVLSGTDGSLIWSATGNPGDFLGAGLSGLDDLNGDGVPEQGASAVGAGLVTGGVSTGAVYIFDGASSSLIRVLTPNGTGFSFGQFFVHDAGDVDADGVGDIYVGDFSDSKGGRGYVYSGDEEERLRLFNAEDPSDGLGIGRGAGDIDGDGHDDLLVGAYLSSEGAFQGGKCYVFSGKNGRTIRSFTSTVFNAQIGFDVVRLGDVTGDGSTDFLLTGLDIAFVVAGN